MAEPEALSREIIQKTKITWERNATIEQLLVTIRGPGGYRIGHPREVYESRGKGSWRVPNAYSIDLRPGEEVVSGLFLIDAVKTDEGWLKEEEIPEEVKRVKEVLKARGVRAYVAHFGYTYVPAEIVTRGYGLFKAYMSEPSIRASAWMVYACLFFEKDKEGARQMFVKTVEELGLRAECGEYRDRVCTEPVAHDASQLSAWLSALGSAFKL